VSDRTPPVALALLNWNGWRDTIACLASLEQLRYPSPGLILCDNASTDDSVDRVVEWARTRGWSIRVVDADLSDGTAKGDEARLLIVRSRTNRGFAGGTNVAIRFALASPRAYHYVWTLNTDTLVEPGSLELAVRALEAVPTAASAQSLLLWGREPTLLDSAGMRLLSRGGAVDVLHRRTRAELDNLLRGRPTVEIFGCCAAAALYRVDALRVVGLFDEEFFQTNEDVDLACRLRSRGFTALLVSESVVHHLGGISRDRKKKGRIWWIAHRNKLRVVARWYPRLLGALILTAGTVRAFIAAMRSPDVPLSMWLSLPGVLWRDWCGGASGAMRGRILRLGSAGMIV
jgi:GT2 family glycosyltransferase